MNKHRDEKLISQLEDGKVYSWVDLCRFSKSVDGDLLSLVASGELEQVAPGLYTKPKSSRFGLLAPDENELVKQFLNDERFLLYSWNEYNNLGLGLTQLYMHKIVYNYKCHGRFILAGKRFDFRRPDNGFPKGLSREFLLVDMVNNLDYLAEDKAYVLLAIERNKDKFNMLEVVRLSNLYGDLSTNEYLMKIMR